MDNVSLYNHFLGSFGLPARLSALALRDLLQLQLQSQSVNPLNRFGNKVYSQNDEDGLINEILRRLRISKGVFAEFGVGNGLENNTLALLAAGWQGVWIGGEDIAFNWNPLKLERPKFSFLKSWVTPENATELLRAQINMIEVESVNVLSIDLDGNDLHVFKALLSAGIAPDLCIVEYNSKFAPPIEFSVDCDPSHQWAGDDYMGASLQSLVNVAKEHEYSLVCCNLSGCNAFFVKDSEMDSFRDVPVDIGLIYCPPRYYMSYMYGSGHPSSHRTVEWFIKKL